MNATVLVAFGVLKDLTLSQKFETQSLGETSEQKHLKKKPTWNSTKKNLLLVAKQQNRTKIHDTST